MRKSVSSLTKMRKSSGQTIDIV